MHIRAPPICSQSLAKVKYSSGDMERKAAAILYAKSNNGLARLS